MQLFSLDSLEEFDAGLELCLQSPPRRGGKPTAMPWAFVGDLICICAIDPVTKGKCDMSMTMDASADAPMEFKPIDMKAPLLLADTMPTPDYATPDGAGPGRFGTSGMPDHLMPELVTEKPWYRRSWLAIALIVVALYSVVVFRYWGAADQGVDQNAYLVGGRLLAEHFSMKYSLPNPYAYVGGMMVRMTPPDDLTNNIYYPKYPFGLPLLYAGFFWAFKIASVLPILKHHVHPEQAAYWAFLVSPVSSVLAIAGMFFVARQVAGSFAAVMASILLGTSQLMMMLMDNPNSHAACLAFVVWGMYFCIRWMTCGNWKQYIFGALGGLLVGYAGTIRDSEKTLFIAMCVLVLSRLPWNQWKSYLSASIAITLGVAAYMIYAQISNAQAAVAGTEAKWVPSELHKWISIYSVLIVYSIAGVTIGVIYYQLRDWLMYARAIVPGLAWAIPVGILMLVNLRTTGHLTGYDSTHESEFGAAFQWKFFWQNWEKAVRVFYDMGLFFVVPFAVAGIFMLFRKSWRVGLLMLAWLVPGVMLYMSYYWSPDFSDAYARFFLAYMPALLVGVAVCFHDGILGRAKEWRSGIALPISVGVVVAIAAGISSYRTIHGLRDGSQQVKVPLNDFREREALAQTGQMLLANVPAKSVLFAENTGGISTPANYIQFLNDWEFYGADAFSNQESRRGFGPPGGNQQRGRGNGGNGNFRGNNNGGGRGNFGGPPGGGGFGGPPPGPGGGMAGQANANQADTTPIATPTQKEQSQYHAKIYNDVGLTERSRLKAQLLDSAFAKNQRVFIAVASEHVEPYTEVDGVVRWTRSSYVADPMYDFKESLYQPRHYKFKVITRWTDVALPEEKDDTFELTDNSPMGGGGRRGGGMNFGRMLLANDRIMDWQLIEVLPAEK